MAEMTDDLAMLVRKLAYSLRKVQPDNELSKRAMGYLVRKGLQGSILREDDLALRGLEAQTNDGPQVNEAAIGGLDSTSLPVGQPAVPSPDKREKP